MSLRMLDRSSRSLFRDQAAVSAVVGILILVVIAVALSAVVFILANRTAEDSGGKQTPPVGIAMDPGNARMSVVTAPADRGLHYAPNPGDVGLRWSGDCDIVSINGQPPSSTMEVAAGDRIQTDCTFGQILALVDSESNTVIAILRVPCSGC